MRDLVINTIEKNFQDNYQEIGRNLFSTICYPHPILTTLEEIAEGKHELLVPWLKSLTNEQLLGVLKSQLCGMFR